MYCVILENMDDEFDHDHNDSDDEYKGDEEGDAETGTGAGGESDEGSDDDGDDADTDEDWAPDGVQIKLQRALKVSVPPAAVEALEAAQLTMTLAGAVLRAGRQDCGRDGARRRGHGSGGI